MAWIELHQALRDHRKTMDLAAELDIIEPYAMGHLSCLWLWALDNAPDGVLRTCSARIIARASGYPNSADTFVNALEKTGFLERDDDGNLIIHDWMDYAGKLIERREANAERMRTARAIKPKERATHVQRTIKARAGATVPNPTEPNPTEPDPFAENDKALEAANAATAQKKTPKAAKAKVEAKERTPLQRERDEIWQALEEVIGHPCPAGQSALWGKMVTAFKDEYHATPQDIVIRAQVHKDTKDWDFTLNSLMKHWYECEPGKGTGSGEKATGSNGHRSNGHVQKSQSGQGRASNEVSGHIKQFTNF